MNVSDRLLPTKKDEKMDPTVIHLNCPGSTCGACNAPAVGPSLENSSSVKVDTNQSTLELKVFLIIVYGTQNIGFTSMYWARS